MNVFGHQAIGPAGHAVGPTALGDEVAIEGVVARPGEQGLPTIAPLCDVMRQAGNGDTGETGHAPMIGPAVRPVDFARRYPAKPRPAKPTSMIAQVDGSGIAAAFLTRACVQLSGMLAQARC